MSNSIQFQDFRMSTSSPSALSRAIDNPFRKFSNPKFNPVGNGRAAFTVTFVDFLGHKHVVHCKTKSAFIKQKAFFDALREESATIKALIADYPMSFGRVPAKFHKALKADLKAFFGFQKPLIDYIVSNC